MNENLDRARNQSANRPLFRVASLWAEQPRKARLVFCNDTAIGEVIGKTYVTRRGPATFFRKFNGFGLSGDLLHLLMLEGIELIFIDYRDGSRCEYFEIGIEDFIKFGQRFTFLHPYYGQDVQLVTNKECMKAILQAR